ncbi:MAG: signal peptidase I [Desulfurococcaceae archaeon]
MKPRSFFRTMFFKFLSYASIALLLLLIVLLAFTVLSRLGYFNFIGVSIVFSESMEPALKRGDLVIYFNTNYTVGDIVVYCLNPSHCIVHRVIGFLHVDATNGEKVLVLTKGDNVDKPDSPFNSELIKGKVVFRIIRELWVPLFIILLAYTFYDVAKTPIIGYSIVILLFVSLASITALYALVPRHITLDFVEPPVLNLAGVYFEPGACTVRVQYTGELSLTSVDLKVNSTSVNVASLSEREVVFKPGLNLLKEAFEHRKPLLIEVNAVLNNVGKLTGEYTLLIGGEDPVISNIDNAISIENNNCFPISINISIRYLRGNEWMWSNQTRVVEGFSRIVIEPPENSESAYVYIYWFNQGDSRWVGLPLKTG